jgi:hypothetical protein
MKFNETNQDRSYKVTFTGTVSHVGGSAAVDTLVIDKSGSYHYFNRKSAAEFELAGPMYWPPQENDVWKGDGDFVYHCIGGSLFRKDSVGKPVFIDDDSVLGGNDTISLLFRSK